VCERLPIGLPEGRPNRTSAAAGAGRVSHQLQGVGSAGCTELVVGQRAMQPAQGRDGKRVLRVGGQIQHKFAAVVVVTAFGCKQNTQGTGSGLRRERAMVGGRGARIPPSVWIRVSKSKTVMFQSAISMRIGSSSGTLTTTNGLGAGASASFASAADAAGGGVWDADAFRSALVSGGMAFGGGAEIATDL
jgi:hypothetical protein